MPTYAYRCPKCGREFEKFQRITDPAGARCPACRSAAERVITGGGGVIFKGSGFYQTDYRSAGYKKAAESERSPAAPDEGTSAAKAEVSSEAAKGEAKREAAAGAESTSPKPEAKPPAKKARKPSDEG